MFDKQKKCMSKTVSILVCVGILSSNIGVFPIKNVNAQELNYDIEIMNDEFNGGYELVESPTDVFKDFWENGIKPKSWDLRVYKDFAKPIGSVIHEGSLEGENSVRIDLNKSVGFFQTAKNMPINGDKEYEISTNLKLEDLNVKSTNTSHKPLAIRVEQFGADGKLVSGGRTDIAKFEGTKDWQEYKYTIKTKPDAKTMKLIFVFDSGLATGANGTLFIDNTSITTKEIKPENIEFLTQDLEMGVGFSEKLDTKITPEDSTVKDIIWSSSDSSIVSVENGVINSHKEGEAIVTASIKGYEDINTSINVKVSNEILIENIEFDNQNIELGRNFVVEGKVYPKYATEDYSLKSTDSSVAEIKDGVLYSKGVGSTEIIALNSKGEEVGRFNLSVNENVIDKYDVLLERVYDSLVPNKLMVANSIETINYINGISKDGKETWETLNKNADREALWNNFPNTTTSSSNVTKTFENVLKLSKAFATKGSELYGDEALLKDIVSCLEWINKNMYREGIYYANWWDWQIGAPQKLNDILVVMKDYMTDEQIKKQTDASSWYVKNARDQWRGNTTTPDIVRQTVGANRTDMVKVVAVRSMITKEGDKLKEASNDILQELEYVTKGDGFYKDGSIVQHSNIAYTGTYGAILLAGIGETVYMLNGSEWTIPAENLNNMYDVVTKSFEPVMFKGLMMDMVSGRAISRSNATDANHGGGVLKSMVKYYSRFAPEPYKSEFLSIIKGWLVENDEYNFVDKIADYEFKMLATNIINDDSIKIKEPLEGLFNFANMDRVVYRNKDFALGLSMYSSRIANYEVINGENLKGFHTGDGMVYLYNGDLSQYQGDYWATVDPYRLPGTTVDSMKLADSAGKIKTSKESFVGGSVIGNEYGSFAMQLNKSNDGIKQDLKAKKSYFMMDGKIVFLGSDINSSTDTNIETIIENRKLSEGAKEKITIDNKNSIKNIGDEMSSETSWVHFGGEGEDNQIGYYFPNKAKINVKRDAREGRWKDVNSGGSDSVVKDNYFTMWLDHGIAPSDSTYEYIMIPNADKNEMKRFDSENEIKIVYNNSEIQAVKDTDADKNKNIIAMNVWQDGSHKIDDITVYNKSSVTILEEDGQITIGVSDPTMLNKDKIRIELDKKIRSVDSKNERVSISKENDKTILEFDVSGLKGETIEAKLNLFNQKLEKPSNLTVDEISKNSIEVAWEKQKDAIINEYILYKDGKEFDRTTDTSYKFESLKANKIYQIKVVAVGENGKKSKPASITVRTEK